MKLAVASVTHSSVHSLDVIQRHFLDWKLQTDQRFHLSILSDGPWETREDRVSPADLDFGASATFIEYRKRRRAWGAYCRQDWLATLDPEEFPFVLMLCADDQVNNHLVETVFREMDDQTDYLMWLICHHHYGSKPIPMGTWPTLSRCDWSSGVIRTSIAQKAGINYPEEYAGDGHYWQDCFAVTGQDTSRIKILDSYLVFKN